MRKIEYGFFRVIFTQGTMTQAKENTWSIFNFHNNNANSKIYEN